MYLRALYSQHFISLAHHSTDEGSLIRKEAERSWDLKDVNDAAFPVFDESFDRSSLLRGKGPASLSKEQLEAGTWDLAQAKGPYGNDEAFPLPEKTKPEECRAAVHEEKTALDFAVDVDVFATGHGQTTEVMKNTEDEDKFVESWAETSLRPDLETDKPLNFELEGSAWEMGPALGAFKDDVVTGYIESVIKAREALKAPLGDARMEVSRKGGCTPRSRKSIEERQRSRAHRDIVRPASRSPGSPAQAGGVLFSGWQDCRHPCGRVFQAAFRSRQLQGGAGQARQGAPRLRRKGAFGACRRGRRIHLLCVGQGELDSRAERKGGCLRRSEGEDGREDGCTRCCEEVKLEASLFTRAFLSLLLIVN